jgi:sialic acid synthase SpsE
MIVCEVGLNHLGDVQMVSQYIEKACQSNLDAVTFQVREDQFYEGPRHHHLLLPDSVYAEAQRNLKQYGKKTGYAVAEICRVDALAELGADFFKILSWDITNELLIQRMLKTDVELIFVSTGMSNFAEIECFADIVKGQEKRIRLIHTQLSMDIEQVNLRAIEAMRERFPFPIAYGHHCSNLSAMYLSLAFQPSDIFFYIKGEAIHNYPDDSFAVYIGELSEVSEALKLLPLALGRSDKSKMENEIESKRAAVEFV